MRAQIFTAASAANLSLALGFVRCSRPSSAGPRGFGESKAGDGSNVCKLAAIVPLVARD